MINLKNSINNLAIVSNKFQLLNIISLCHHKNENYPLLILIYNNINTYQGIKEHASHFKIKIIYALYSRKYFQYVKALLIGLKINRIQKLIIGNLENNIILFLARIIRWKEIIFVDDGNILEVYNKKPKISNQNLPIDFFTIFKLKSNNYYNIIFNDYSFFKNSTPPPIINIHYL